MAEPDELYTLRNLFWLGNYQLAINEANSLHRLNPQLTLEKQDYIYRSYLAMGQMNLVLQEIKDNAPPSLQAIKCLAQYLHDPSSRGQVKSHIESLASSESRSSTINIVAATIALHEDEIKDAIFYVSNENNQEERALLVQLYLRIDRTDLALKVLKSMKSFDDDGVLTMLSNAWISLRQGSATASTAGSIYEELIDKYGGSPLLLNGLASSRMQQGQFEEAESLLLDSLAKSPTDVDTLANLISLSYHLNKPADVIQRYMTQLKSKSKDHHLVTALDNFKSAYERVEKTLL